MGYNSKELRTKSTASGKVDPYKKDVIYDPRGQWAFPGQVTKVPGGDITMHGVPYPVIGVDNLGNAMMMMPGMNYSFPGSSVTEFPQLKKGGEPSADTAKRMLKDGTAHGHPLTSAQRERFAEIAGTDIYGNEPEEEEDEMREYKRGGGLKREPKGRTSKNIQTSINEITMKRNELIYGPHGKRYFKPFLEGGENHSNDQPMKKLNTKEVAFPQQPTVAKFDHRGFVPNAPVGFYMHGGMNTERIAFPQQPPADIFFSGYPWQPKYMHGGMNTNEIAFPQQPDAAHFFSGYPFQPQYAKGGMPCFECGGAHMEDGGSVFGYGEFPAATQFGGNVGAMEADKDMFEMYKKGGNWIQDANKKMKAKGTKGAFTDYCGGKVTDACIERGLNSPDPTTRKRAAFAKAMRKISKAEGGESPQGYDMSNVLDSNKNAFQSFLANNTMSAIQNEVEDQIFQQGGDNFNYMNQEKLNYANNMLDQMDQRGQAINRNFLGQTTNLLGNMYAKFGLQTFQTTGQNNNPTNTQGTGAPAANTPSYLTKDELNALLDQREKAWQQQMAQQYSSGYGQPSYGYGQPVSYYRGQGMQGYFPMNPMGPYYKTKFKGWSNVPSTYGMPQQYAGISAGAPQYSGELSDAQKEEIGKYYADRGIKATIEQDVKRGLLGKWLGPRRVKTSYSFTAMPGQGTPGTNTPTPASNTPATNLNWVPQNAQNIPTGNEAYNYTPVEMDPNQLVGRPIASEPLDMGNAVELRYGGLNMFANGGTEPGLNTAGPLSWGFNSVEKRKMGFAPGTADWMVGAEYAGANLLGNVLGANRSEKKAMEKWMESKQGADANYYAMGMDKGDHTKDVYGTDTLMPDQIGVKVEPWAMGQFQGNRGDAYYQGKFGGAFMAQGGQSDEVYMTEDEIKQFMAMGGRVEFLD